MSNGQYSVMDIGKFNAEEIIKNSKVTDGQNEADENNGEGQGDGNDQTENTIPQESGPQNKPRNSTTRQGGQRQSKFSICL